MALQFITGGAGSGKTRYLYQQAIRESLVHPDLTYLVVVPEQYTMQTQKEIIRLHPRHGVLNIDIVSFKRLACRVFEDMGVQLPVVLDDMGKSMVLRKVAGNNRGKLGLYGRHLDQAGFINQLKSQVSELYQYGLGPEELKKVREATDHPLLKQKLQDLELIYTGFRDYIEDHYITSEEILDILCRQLPSWQPLKDCVIFLDGYTGYTPVQYRIIELFLQHAREVFCCVTSDAGIRLHRECSIQHLFYMSCHTVCRLTRLADRHHVEVKPDIDCSGRPAWRFAESAELDFLEQNLYRYKGKTWKEPTKNLCIYQGQNPEDEAGFVCSQIQKMVQEQGLRYRDAAVVTGDLASYGRELSHRFKEAGIPYFLDDKRSILENPLVELIRAALETVRDFSYESVFRYLKTGLVQEEGAFEEEMDYRLENYVRALGIRGWKQWNSQWERQYRGSDGLNLQELNEYRQWLIKPLGTLRQAFKEEGATMSSVTAALKDFMEELNLREKMEKRQEQFHLRQEPGDENRAREYSQIYDRVLELFERLEGLLGDEKADMKNYMQILDAGFEEIRVGTIPATVDQVMVGDITRSRLEDVKVLFFVGVNEGIVPQRKTSGGILTDSDREVFRSMDLELAPTAREDGCIQKFYLYLMLSKPSRGLVLTWAAMSGQGKSQRPSSLIGELKKLFPQICEIDRQQLLWPVRSERDVRERLTRGLRTLQKERQEETIEEGLETSVKELLRHCGPLREPLLEAAFYSYEERGIGRAAARALYGQILSGSVTRMEQFASCAYAHFLKYGLELMERQEYELRAVDMGNLFHQSIDRFFAAMAEQGRDWNSLTQENLKQLVKECVAQVTGDYGNTIMASSARNTYLAGRVERMTERTIWALAKQLKKGDFVPAGFEVSFSAVDDLKAMRIRLSEDEQLQLRGRIDRLDLCEDEKSVYVKIIDYKSGSTSFNLAALYYGLQLQLVVYMDAALELQQRRFPDKEAVPAGIFYYHIDDPMAEQQGDNSKEEIEAKILRQLRMDGLVNSELSIISHLDREIQKESDVIPVALKDGYVQEARSSVASTARFKELRRFVNEKLKQSGQQILRGQTDLKPIKDGSRTACDYCPYHAVCGFDTKTAGYGYRRLRSMKPEEIWAEIEGKEKQGDGSKMDEKTAAGN